MKDANSRGFALAVYVLFLLSFFTGLTAFIGVIIAHVKEPDSRSPFKSHFKFQIRTFWFGFLTVILGYLLTSILVGYLILLWFIIWTLIRCVKGLVRAFENKAIEDEDTLLW